MSEGTAVGNITFGPCARCGQYHNTPVAWCPQPENPVFMPIPSSGDEIVKRLDRIIELLEGLQPPVWRGGPR